MTDEIRYQSGFGNEFATEAVPGALPAGQNAPQNHLLGLYTEQFSGTPFTAPRATNRRTWTYRIRPSVTHRPYEEIPAWASCAAARSTRCLPRRINFAGTRCRCLSRPTDFLDGIVTLGGNGDPAMQTGIAIHLYAANASMHDRFFSNADGEMLIVPQLGALQFPHRARHPRSRTRRNLRHSARRQIPRRTSRQPGARLHLRELRAHLPPARTRPHRRQRPCQSARLPMRLSPPTKIATATSTSSPNSSAGFGSATIDHSPLDVVAWHGNYAPYKYDLALFNCINTVSFDHPDPSIYTVLTAPSTVPGTANCDFAIFPPRWMVAEHTFRPPWFHRNLMNEFMGLVFGAYDAKAEGFVPGGASLHNCMAGHGPDAETFERASHAELESAVSRQHAGLHV